MTRARSASIAALALFAALSLDGARASELPRCREQDVAYSIAGGESYGAYRGRARRAACRKPWTVLVYMAADNELAPYAYWDLYEMEAGFKSGRLAAGSTVRSDLLVQLNAPGAAFGKRYHVFQAPEHYDRRLGEGEFRVRDGTSVRSPVAEEVSLRGERGEALPAADDFERFLAWGIREYPSEHYMVVVWGHGQGWAPASVPPLAEAVEALETKEKRFGGIAFSRSHGTYLDIPSLAQALRSVEEKLLGGRRVDVYASDACLMQATEIAYELKDAARFVVGSSQISNFLGLPYRRLMFELNTGRFSGERARPGVRGGEAELDEPYLLARMLPRIFRMSLGTHGLHGQHLPEAIRTFTISSISSDELASSLAPALRALGSALGRYLDEDPLRAIPIARALSAAPAFMGGSQELGASLRLLRQAVSRQPLERGAGTPAEADVLAAIDATTGALDRAVVAYALGTHYSGQESALHLLGIRALAIWLPWTRAAYASRAADFASSRFYLEQGEAWSGWLRRLHPAPRQ